MMRTNKTKAKLRAGELCVGAVIKDPSPELVELSAAVGFDFVTFDAEHEPFDDRDLVHLIRAAEAFDVTPIVRLAKDPDRILRCLDMGAQGIHVPRCNTGGDVQDLVDACRFYPQGKRTFYALGRSANYAMGVDDAAWSRRANEELLLVAMVEEVAGMSNLDDILAVEQLDVIHIGPKDLWQSMGMPAQDIVDAAVAQITRQAVAAGRHVSIQTRVFPDTVEKIAGHVERGARMITVSPLDFIRNGATAFLHHVRSGFAG